MRAIVVKGRQPGAAPLQHCVLPLRPEKGEVHTQSVQQVHNPLGFILLKKVWSQLSVFSVSLNKQGNTVWNKLAQSLSVTYIAVTRVMTGCERLPEELNVSQQWCLTGPSHQRMWLLPVDKVLCWGRARLTSLGDTQKKRRENFLSNESWICHMSFLLVWLLNQSINSNFFLLKKDHYNSWTKCAKFLSLGNN